MYRKTDFFSLFEHYFMCALINWWSNVKFKQTNLSNYIYYTYYFQPCGIQTKAAFFLIYNKKSSEQKTVERFQSLSVLSSIRKALSTQLYNYNTHRYICIYKYISASDTNYQKGFHKKKRENNTGVAYRNIISKTYLELINKTTWSFIMEIQNIFQ